jgi:beta-lactamase regulating signal transducer with metallopeptidase domain
MMEAMGLALLHLLWQGALIAALLFVALKLVHDSDVRYTAACAALAALVMFGIATAYRVYEPPISPASFQPMPEIDRAIPAITDSPTVTTAPSTSIVDTVLLWTRRNAGWIVLTWLVGVLVLTIRLGVSWRRAQAVVRRLASPAPEWQGTVARLAGALGISRAIRVLETAAVEVPSVVGWLRPVILLPVSSVTGLTPQQLEMVLAHELAHVRRHDFLVNVLQSVVETLLFYHPAAWWISRQIRIERENCCDDLAVAICGNALQYARTLTMLEQMRSTPVMGVAATGGSLLERIRRLVVRHTDRSSLITGWTALAAGASFVLLLMITSVPVMADREENETPKPPEAEITVKTPRVRTRAPRPAVTPRAVRTAVEAPMAMAAAIADDIDIDIDIDPTPEPDEEGSSQPVGSTGKLSVDDLISLRVAGVTPQYMDEMRRLFGDSITIREISSLKMHGLTAAYVSEMRSLFGASLSSRDILSLQTHGATPEYIREMRGVFGDLTARDIASMKSLGVTSKWLQEMRAAGVEVKTARDASSLLSVGVTPAFVKALADAGYPNLNVRDLKRLAANGINAEFIREIAKYREKK